MQAIADRTDERGAVEMKLSVAVANAPALALYEAVGFEPLILSMRKAIRNGG